MTDRLLYVICIIFSAVSVSVIAMSGEVLLGTASLLFFGGGGTVYYFLSIKGWKKPGKAAITESRKKLTALLAGCLIFIVCSYLFLPFHHLFDDIPHYSPALGYIVGIAGLLFSGFGLTATLFRLAKPVAVMQISDDGLLIFSGKKQELLRWNEMTDTSCDDKFLHIHMDAPDPAAAKTVSIPVGLIEYDLDDIEYLIRKKKLESLCG